MSRNENSRSIVQLINNYKIWNFVEVKACLLRYNDHYKFIPLFLHIKFLDKKIPTKKIKFRHDLVKLIHIVLPINKIVANITDLITNNSLVLENEEISLEEFEKGKDFQLKIRSITNRDYYIDSACWVLQKSSNFISTLEYRQFERNLRNKLPLNNPPYEDLNDICNSVLKIRNIQTYFPHVRIILPLFVKINVIELIADKKILISLYKSEKVQKNKLFINIIGKNISNEVILRHQIKSFTSLGKTQIHASQDIQNDSWDIIIISLYFHGEKMDEYFLKRIGNQIMNSREEKIEIIQPLPEELFTRRKNTLRELIAKAKEIKDNNNEKGDLLEKGIIELLSLVPGFSILQVDSNSGIEEIDIIVKNKNNQGIWTKFESIIFIECKNWNRKIGSKEIRDFEGKLRNYWLHGGIFVGINGFAGNQRTGALGQIKMRFMQEKMIIVSLEENDINKILNNYDISQLIEDKIDNLYTTN